MNERTFELATDRVRIEIGAQNEQMERRIYAIVGDFNGRGVLRSGGFLLAIAEECSRAAEERCDIAWRAFYRVISASPLEYSDSLGATIRAALDSSFNFGDLDQWLYEWTQRVPLQNAQAISECVAVLDKGRQRGLQRMRNEIDLFVETLRARAADEVATPAAGHTFNVYAPVGALQVGDHTTAHVNQTIGGREKGALAEVLSKLEQRLQALEEAMPPEEKVDALELVHDARVEVQKPRTNIAKLKSLLSSAGGMLHRVADLKEAYDAVKVVAEACGLPMP